MKTKRIVMERTRETALLEMARRDPTADPRLKAFATERLGIAEGPNRKANRGTVSLLMARRC